MANVNGVRDIAGQLEKQLEILEEADIPERDREAIRAWYKNRKRSLEDSTLRSYLGLLTTSSERAHRPLVDFEGVTDVDELLDTHEEAGCRAAKSLNNHLVALRNLWKWLDSVPEVGQEEYRFRHFNENVQPSPKNPGTEPVDPSFVLTEIDIIALREAAASLRDKAIIEFLADCGPRITLACQMLRGDVSLPIDGRPTFRPNAEGQGQKQAPIKDYLLHESSRHLRLYLTGTHPDDHPGAPLFAKRRGYNPDIREEGALHPKTAQAMLSKTAKRAGIDSERVHPHNFRRAAVTRMRVKHDMSWDAIQARTGWSDTSVAEMKQYYQRIENSDELDMVAREFGDVEPDDEPETLVEMAECVGCGRDIHPKAVGCEACGARQDIDEDALTVVHQDALWAIARLDEATAGTVVELIEAAEARAG